MDERKHVLIYTDGSSRGNPGPGGYGAVLQYRDSSGALHEKELSQGFERTTNNRMELTGPIRALEQLRVPCRVDLVSDSRYLVDAFEKHWIDGWKKRGWVKSDKKPVLNQDLWKALLDVMAPHEVTFHWVEGHAGHPENERCDRLATAAADSGALIPDPGFSEEEPG